MKFSNMTILLFQYIEMIGQKWTYGDAYRDPRCNYGSERSLHRERLAIDINLFKSHSSSAGVSYTYLTKTEDYKIVGEFWESIGGTWGGRFNDGNHFSLAHEGRK